MHMQGQTSRLDYTHMDIMTIITHIVMVTPIITTLAPTTIATTATHIMDMVDIMADMDGAVVADGVVDIMVEATGVAAMVDMAAMVGMAAMVDMADTIVNH